MVRNSHVEDSSAPVKRRDDHAIRSEKGRADRGTSGARAHAIRRVAGTFAAITAALAMMIAPAASAAPAATKTGASALSPVATYTGDGMTFSKISHAGSGVETNDGIVDYAGKGLVRPYEQGVSQEGNGSRGQSYSYASAVYGDWVYINTMYGGLGIANILNYSVPGMSAEAMKAAMDTMYNGNLYMGEPDGMQAGGILVKVNVKTGEMKILMSRETGVMPTFRDALVLNGKIYFVGMIVDTTHLNQKELATALARQNGFPVIYQIDPEDNDRITCVYDALGILSDDKATSEAGKTRYDKLIADNVFTSTRAIADFNGTLIAGALDNDGVFLTASKDPSAGKDSFKTIATMEDFGGEPAWHRTDVNGGGGIYQAIEYNGQLYVVVCTGTPANQNAQGTKRAFSIWRGTVNGDPTERSSWTWSRVVGDTAKGARYTYGIDPSRISAGAATLVKYNGHLYIGDYNDVSSALQGFVLQKNFTTQATNLEQSINLYRMDADENIELVVGDPTDMFPKGGISGTGTGYGSHMNQYTWQATVYEGKLYIGTMDTTTLLEPIAQFTNGDLIHMTPDEWKKQINYLRVFLELLIKDAANSGKDAANGGDASGAAMFSARSADSANTDSGAAADLVASAVTQASDRKKQTMPQTLSLDSKSGKDSATKVSLTDDQTTELVKGITDGDIVPGSLDDTALTDQINDLNNQLNALDSLIGAKASDGAQFRDAYAQLLDEYAKITVPDNLKPLYDMLLKLTTKENLQAYAKSVKYLKTSKRGFDLYAVSDKDGKVNVETVTNNGFGDRYNHGLRIFAKTSDYLLIGTANPFYGTQLWRTPNTQKVKYAITVNDDGNGTASADVTTAAQGERVTLAAKPNDGYRLKEWKVLYGGVDVKDNAFAMTNKDVAIQAVFEKTDASDGGSGEPNQPGDGTDQPGGETTDGGNGGKTDGNGGNATAATQNAQPNANKTIKNPQTTSAKKTNRLSATGTAVAGVGVFAAFALIVGSAFVINCRRARR
ncbi:InlB B-repeat-containing protein [Bifidobacterium callimiconis]|uniref:Bacterial repeat domain-containing protein n=1 Tax=Bifidobacterium callimiconis TaxID=2306973 RepID=A0A430FFE6_9BIFI|nr:hypothetical protein [Bifidobacterium callimiconis]RSX51579.1 hypothetical protein D2E23_0842 [Bifidobacterium callimiconis]